MTIRWDLLSGTHPVLQRSREPTTADCKYDYPVIWIYTAQNLAWLLTPTPAVLPLPPTTGVSSGVTPLATTVANLESTVNDMIDAYMKKSVYDTDSDSVVDEAETIDGGAF